MDEFCIQRAELTFQEIDRELDRIQRELDELECDLIARKCMRQWHLRSTVLTQQAVREIVERYYHKWREKNVKKPSPA